MENASFPYWVLLPGLAVLLPIQLPAHVTEKGKMAQIPLPPMRETRMEFLARGPDLLAVGAI